MHKCILVVRVQQDYAFFVIVAAGISAGMNQITSQLASITQTP